MAKTVVGMFDSASEARAAVEELVSSGLSRGDISLVAHQASDTADGGAGTTDATGATHAAAGAGIGAGFGGLAGLLLGLGVLAIPGFGPVIAAGPIVAALAGAGIGAAAGGLIGGLTHVGVPEEHAHHYAEGVRRGGTLVTVNAPDEMADRAADVLRRNNAVDVHKRAEQWRTEGWKGYDAKAPAFTREEITRERARYANRDVNQGRVAVPVIEEQVSVSKRAVEQGGVRVFSRMVETPVEQSVQLRDEKVTVERHPVNRPISPAEATAFQGGTMEFKETREEAVVHKTARVVEEVVIGKDVRERTETVRDTVKRTDVQVEQTGARAAGAARGFEAYDADFRGDFQSRYAATGGTYEAYQPAYRYGYDLAADPRYQGRDWPAVEADARRDWEARGGAGPWERFKDSVRFAWDRARGRATTAR